MTDLPEADKPKPAKPKHFLDMDDVEWRAFKRQQKNIERELRAKEAAYIPRSKEEEEE